MTYWVSDIYPTIMAMGIKKIEYISLAEAATYCNYSQDYLSLRARQGKLKSKKFGRNWVTTRQWLEEYIKQVENYNNETSAKKVDVVLDKSQTGLKTFDVKPQEGVVKLSSITPQALPPDNLPVGEPLIFIEDILQPSIGLRVAFSSALVILAVLVGTLGVMPILDNHSWKVTVGISEDYGAWLAEQTFATGAIAFGLVADAARGKAQINVRGIARFLKEAMLAVKGDVELTWNNLAKRIKSLAGIKEKDQRAISDDKLARETTQLQENIVGDIQKRFGEFKEEFGISKKESEGLVVVPSTERDEEVKDEIITAFSDEVVIEPKDETSGIIRPIFRTVAEQAYLYMMVPLKN